MTKILIVSKTHMSSAACVGALTGKGRSLRLLDNCGNNQPTNTDFEIRQIWDIEYRKKRNLTPPHTEDILVTSKKLRKTLKSKKAMLQAVKKRNAPIWRGSPDILFDGCLQWTDSGSGYVSKKGKAPHNSVGFWIPDMALKKRISFDKVRYDYPNTNGRRSLPFVGFAKAVGAIPKGTLIRVSLARWWDRNGETELRCSLQLSGWYDLS